METSFFSGSENLYKYLVTVGILLIVLTVYYPLKEKQELEILQIKIENELEILNYKILENQKEVEKFKIINKDTIIENESKEAMFSIIKDINKSNQLNQIAIQNKNNELKARKDYIEIYNILFWIFLPLGILLIGFGFFKWNKTKKVDDNIMQLEKQKLEYEVAELEARRTQEQVSP